MSKQGLTPKQKELFDFIQSFTKEYGFAPTLIEMARHFDKTQPTIQYIIKQLIDKGWISHKKSKTRDYVVIYD